MIPALEIGAIGFVAGIVGAALGVGGGVILVPGFILLAGLAPRAAVGTSLVCVVGTAATATWMHVRQRTLGRGDGLDLPLYGVLGAVAAGLAAVLVPSPALLAAFAVLLLITAGRMWPRAAVRHDAPVAPRPMALRTVIAGGGAVAGLFGVGGGVVFVPVLHLWGGRSFHRSAALSLLIILATAAAGGAVYFVRGDVNVAVAFPALVGTLAGAGLGVPLAQRLRQRWLKGAFALLLVYVAVELVREALG